MGIKSVDAQLCDGCGICVEVCPFDVLKLDPSTCKAVVAYIKDCYDRCYDCAEACPVKGAIESA